MSRVSLQENLRGIKSVVAVGAHADDLELHCFGTLALFKHLGVRITLVVMTTTPSIDHFGRIFRPEGEKEIREGARLLEVDEPILLPFRNNEIPYSSDSIQRLNRIFDVAEADLILTHWLWDNQQDHQNTAHAVISAARHFPNILMYEPDIGRPPVSTVPFRPSVFFDISKYFELKLKAIRVHKSQYERLGGDRFFSQREWRA